MLKLKSVEGNVALALIEDRRRSKAIIAAGKRFGATDAEVNEAILTGADAAEFARHHEVESLARQIASA